MYITLANHQRPKLFLQAKQPLKAKKKTEGSKAVAIITHSRWPPLPPPPRALLIDLKVTHKGRETPAKKARLRSWITKATTAKQKRTQKYAAAGLIVLVTQRETLDKTEQGRLAPNTGW